VEAHGLDDGAPAIAVHVAVQHHDVRRVAHQARHPELHTEDEINYYQYARTRTN
jgi:hypothetical protein